MPLMLTGAERGWPMMPTDTLTSATELLTTRQAASLCGMSESTLQRLVKKGVAPAAIKFGVSKQSAVRYRREEYSAWIRGKCKLVDGRAC